MSRRTIELGAIVFALISLCASVAHAQVSDGDWGLTVSAGPIIRTGTTQPAVGPSLAFRASRGLHPLWSIHFDGSIAMPVPTRGEDPYVQGGLFAGVASQLDMTAVVPWLGVSGGILMEPGALEHTHVVYPAIKASVGIDVRRHRNYSMGVEADVIAIFDPKFDWNRYVRIAFRYTWMRSRNNF